LVASEGSNGCSIFFGGAYLQTLEFVFLAFGLVAMSLKYKGDKVALCCQKPEAAIGEIDFGIIIFFEVC
jgi:hypothetical protein